MIKDKLFLMCVHPEKGLMRGRNLLNHILIAAILTDLILLKRMIVQGGKILVSPDLTNDPVVDSILGKLSGMQGKSVPFVMNKLSFSAGKLYKAQIHHLESIHQISVRPMKWLGITWGNLYRVTRSERLKAEHTALERVLVYGRKPKNLHQRLFIQFLGMSGVLFTYFAPKEYRKIARQRFNKLAKAPFEGDNESIRAVIRQLSVTLKAANSGKVS